MKEKMLYYGKRFFCLIVFLLVIAVIYANYLSYSNKDKKEQKYVYNFAKECSYKMNELDLGHINDYVAANLILRDLKISNSYLIQAVDKCIKLHKDK